jgi:hypothetical protein
MRAGVCGRSGGVRRPWFLALSIAVVAALLLGIHRARLRMAVGRAIRDGLV